VHLFRDKTCLHWPGATPALILRLEICVPTSPTSMATLVRTYQPYD